MNTPAFMRDIVNLACRIESAWHRINYTSDDFYKIVWEQSEKFDFGPLGEISAQLEIMGHPLVRALQKQNTFSDLELQIYNDGRFYIEILNWHGSHVNVHDHDFSGVQFQLRGRSLNVVYDWCPTCNFGALSQGELQLRHAELWEEGGRSIVRAGRLDPHCVFHLSRPTASLLIRTVPTKRYGSQLNHFPKLAAHYYVNTTYQRKILTGLALLATSDECAFSEALGRYLNTQSLSENLFTLVKLGSRALLPSAKAVIANYATRSEQTRLIVESFLRGIVIGDVQRYLSESTHSTESERLAVYACIAALANGDYGRIESACQTALAGTRFQDGRELFIRRFEGNARTQLLRALEKLPPAADAKAMRVPSSEIMVAGARAVA
jgi:hypothetical protein